jgi:hypothetical protein
LAATAKAKKVTSNPTPCPRCPEPPQEHGLTATPRNHISRYLQPPVKPEGHCCHARPEPLLGLTQRPPSGGTSSTVLPHSSAPPRRPIPPAHANTRYLSTLPSHGHDAPLRNSPTGPNARALRVLLTGSSTRSQTHHTSPSSTWLPLPESMQPPPGQSIN